MYNYQKLILILLTFFLIVSCKSDYQKPKNISPKSLVNYADGFDIISYGSIHKLIIKKGFQGDNSKQSFIIIPKNITLPDSLKEYTIIRTPIDRIVLTTSTQVTMLQAIDEEKALIGFPNTDYISSKKVRQMIDSGSVSDIGHEQNINYEKLFSLNPDVVMGFGVDTSLPHYDKIRSLDIPVIMNSDWLEAHPLGRAEWIKVFGLLFNKLSQAEIIFNETQKHYLELKALAKKTTDKPTIICGSVFQDVWYAPSGNSSMAKMIKDANAEYIWEDLKSEGNLALSIELVIDKGKKANIWLVSGNYLSLNELKKANKIYPRLTSVQNARVYSYAHLKGDTGGFIYLEESPLHPDFVLEDLINIFHPEILKKTSNNHYFKALD